MKLHHCESKTYNKECAYCFGHVAYNKGEKPEICPHCSRTNYIKTPTELELFKLQHEYQTASTNYRKQDALGRMFLLLKDYSTGKIKKIMRNVMSFNEDLLEERASDSAYHFVIDYYIKRSDFCVEQSFGGLLQKKIEYALYNQAQQRADATMSLDKHLNFYSDGEEDEIDLMNTLEVASSSNFSRYDKYLMRKSEEQDLLMSIKKMLKDFTFIAEMQTNYTTMLYALIGVFMKVHGKDEDDIDSYCQLVKGIHTREMIDQCLTVLLSLLHDNDEHGGFYYESTVI